MLPPVDLDPPRRRHGTAAMLVAAAFVCAACPAAARSAPDLAGLNLRLQPTDVVPPAPPGPPRVPVATNQHDPRNLHGQSVPEIVGEVDKAKPTETPNRRAPGSGPLGDLTVGEGMLQEFLENKTIPLFRVRVAPPF